MKNTEERLQIEKEDGYQKLKSSEAARKELEQTITTLTSQRAELKASVAKLENSILTINSENEALTSSLVRIFIFNSFLSQWLALSGNVT